MVKPSNYFARQPDDAGFIHYTPDEHAVWRDLYASQQTLLRARACGEFIDGLALLQLPSTHIPQCDAVSEQLEVATGWRVTPVAALIGFDEFFDLLSRRIFPAAAFIRTRDEFDYLQEPDIFHELFGHTPLLSNPLFAEFSQRIGEIGLSAPTDYHVWLARLYWMTIEFGLIETQCGLRAYGAGIVSSHAELKYAVQSTVPQRRPFDALTALRTPYRIDELQPVYYVLESFRQLTELAERDLLSLIDEARDLGLLSRPRQTEYAYA